MIIKIFSVFLSLTMSQTIGNAAEWSWKWQPGVGEGPITAEVCQFKYGKDWAYAIEIDDSPKWAASFAVPFLAEYHWTDAPPGVQGGTRKPFVGGVGVIAAIIGSNDASVNWEDLLAMQKVGWGVINHSWSHSGYGWDPKGNMSDEQVLEDAFWSQAILAHGLGTGRAPTAAIYANGYLDYNRNDALKKAGIGIATRIGASSPKDVTNPNLNLMDFTRNYLDENAWVSTDWHSSKPMAEIPDAAGAGPARNSFIIDFTHEIDRNPESANQKRWKERLRTIASKWGAEGTDALWCAPTGEVADYVRAAKAAKVDVSNGSLRVTLPDQLPGTPLTIRLTGIKSQTLQAPPGGKIYRKDSVVWLTTPTIGVPGAPATELKCVYNGPPGEKIVFPELQNVAGVTVDLGGDFPAGFTYKVALQTLSGEKILPVEPLKGGWVVGSKLYSILPSAPAVSARGLSVEAKPGIHKVKVWALPNKNTARK